MNTRTDFKYKPNPNTVFEYECRVEKFQDPAELTIDIFDDPHHINTENRVIHTKFSNKNGKYSLTYDQISIINGTRAVNTIEMHSPPSTPFKLVIAINYGEKSIRYKCVNLSDGGCSKLDILYDTNIYSSSRHHKIVIETTENVSISPTTATF